MTRYKTKICTGSLLIFDYKCGDMSPNPMKRPNTTIYLFHHDFIISKYILYLPPFEPLIMLLITPVLFLL